MNNKGSKLLFMDDVSSNPQLNIIKSKTSLIINECKILLINEISSYISDIDTMTSNNIEDKVGEIALGQDGSKYLQDLIIRLPVLKDYVFQIVSYYHINIIVK
jgi:hypothetical protein